MNTAAFLIMMQLCRRKEVQTEKSINMMSAMIYASETWTIAKALEQLPAVAQRHMERAMIGVSWQDHKTNEWIRRKTKVCDIMHFIRAREWTWAGHIGCIQDNSWASQVTDWRPMDGSRPRS